MICGIPRGRSHSISNAFPWDVGILGLSQKTGGADKGSYQAHGYQLGVHGFLLPQMIDMPAWIRLWAR
jgi:hypothetical protein